jgi:hypothetical protein
MQFFDIGAVVYLLRKCIWWVPDFTVQRYHNTLVDLDAVADRLDEAAVRARGLCADSGDVCGPSAAQTRAAKMPSELRRCPVGRAGLEPATQGL